MNHFQTFQVFPNIPPSLSFLETLSRNIWWCWQYDAVELFRRIDPKLWDQSGRNPIVFLTYIPQQRLEELSRDNSYLSHLSRVQERYEKMVRVPTDRREPKFQSQGAVAYFSMEFGIHESIPLFAGGLGVLAGDHLKAASDMEMPLIGVGLLYGQGYFRQFLDSDGWQQEEYPETDIYHLPVDRAKDRQGNDFIVSVEGPEGAIRAAVWQINVGCIPLLLLDTNLVDNPPGIREITARLYAGEERIRLAQEVLLGIGGMRALAAMGIQPMVCHMNEGHSAFSSLERLVQIMAEYDVKLETAQEIVPRATVFTTHTPVPAGHDEFPAKMVEPYLAPLAKKLGITLEEVLAWGQHPDAGADSPLSMSILGVRMAEYCNGVSELHGKVARGMWSYLWPRRPQEEVPITHVTNGVHIPSWLSHENAMLFDRYLGPEWNMHPSLPENVNRIDDIYEEELWRAHAMSRSRLIRTCRRMMVNQYKRRNAPKSAIKDAETVLEQDVLTVGFARRFATYKRANLLLHDEERFEAMLTSKDCPVQFIFAGKAHPRDNEGKDLIRRLIHFARKANIRHRFVFIEDYDIHLTRHLVHGVDVWLNTPRRPMEACGTSGMKAAINGVLNVSILDGWWCEGYAEGRGWRIGNGEEYSDPHYQDTVESHALYNVLENEVIPCFYERENGDIPMRWLKMMKESMKTGMRFFCSHRMVGEYDKRFYDGARSRCQTLTAEDLAEAKALVTQRERLASLWQDIELEEPVKEHDGPFRVGEKFRVTAIVHLGDLRPEEVDVELYYGIIRAADKLAAGQPIAMKMEQAHGGGKYLYACTISCHVSGRYGFTARVIPRGDAWIRQTPEFIAWA